MDERYFALSFGQGGRFLLRDEVWEERFGLLCALNSVDPNSFRCVDVQSLDAIDSQTRIQSAAETTADKFGLNIEQDMLKAIVGAPLEYSYGSRMAGNDSLSVAVKMDLFDLPILLREYRRKFEADLSVQDHQWVNNISIVKDKELIEKLEASLDGRLHSRDLDGIWLSIPEIIDWEKVDGFIYTNGKKEVHRDINFRGFNKTVKPGESLSLNLLCKARVHCVDIDFQQTYKSWSVFKCLYAEIEFDEQRYILNGGKWFSLASDFIERTNKEFAQIAKSNLMLPKYTGGGEKTYNERVAKNNSSTYALFDAKAISHGGGHGQVEVCDLLSIDKELIHVKIYGKSAVFSHLFSQGFVSGQLIQIDAEFRKKVKEKLKPPFSSLIDAAKKPLQDEFTIIFAIISEHEGHSLNLPFFSRVNLNHAHKVLKGFGYKVELLKILVDESFAKTTKSPPKGGPKKPRSPKI